MFLSHSKQQQLVSSSLLILGLLLLSSPQVKAFCESEQCINDCLSNMNTHKECLFECCEINTINADYVNGCHYQCRTSCLIDENKTCSDNECYSSCAVGCTKGAETALMRIAPDQNSGFKNLIELPAQLSLSECDPECALDDMECLRTCFLKHTTIFAQEGPSQLESLDDSTLKYAQCINQCQIGDEKCLFLCVDLFKELIKPTTTLFAQDNGYNFEHQYSFLNSQNSQAASGLKLCINNCSDNDSDCMNKCIDEYIVDIFFSIQLYTLESYSKCTFDALYKAETDPFDEYEVCKKGCGTASNFECIVACNEELQRKLDEEAYLSLAASELTLFNIAMFKVKQALLLSPHQKQSFLPNESVMPEVEVQQAISQLPLSPVNHNKAKTILSLASSQLAQLIEDDKEISQALANQALMSHQTSDKQEIMQMLELEASKRTLIAAQHEHKKKNILRQLSLIEYNLDLQTQWAFISFENSTEQPQQYENYRISQQNDALIQESHQHLVNNNSECDFICGVQCLATDSSSYSQKQLCMQESCHCSFTLFYYSAEQCDIGCSQNCLLLSNPEGAKACIDQCGCSEKIELPPLSLASSVEAQQSLFIIRPGTQDIPQMSSIKKLYLLMMGVVAVISIIVTLRNVKELREKHHSRKFKLSKKGCKQAILDEGEEESFVIEAKYEKVI